MKWTIIVGNKVLSNPDGTVERESRRKIPHQIVLTVVILPSLKLSIVLYFAGGGGLIFIFGKPLSDQIIAQVMNV